MIWAGLFMLLYWSYCGGMSLLAKGQSGFLQSTLVHVASAVVYVVLASLVAFTFVQQGNPFLTVPAFVLVLILGTLLGLRWWGLMLSEYIDRAHASATGTSNMKVEKTYDRAAKAEREGDLERALAAYGRAAADDPKDPEPLRRMAEIHLRRGDRERAFERFRQALPLIASHEGRATLAFRLADLLIESGRQPEARSHLEAVERDLAGTRFAEFARERLGALG